MWRWMSSRIVARWPRRRAPGWYPGCIDIGQSNPVAGLLGGFVLVRELQVSLRLTLAHRREQDDLAQGVLIRQQLHDPVNADAEAARGGHAVLDRDEEVLVRELGLVVALVLLRRLLEHPLALVDGIVELAVRVRDLVAEGEQFEPLHH